MGVDGDRVFWDKEELAGFSTVRRWLSRLSGDWRVFSSSSSSYNNLMVFRRFMNWVRVNGGGFRDFTPDDLVEFQKEHRDYQLVDLLQDFILSRSGTVKTLEKYRANVNSFFLHNRAGLSRDPAFRLKADNPPVRGDLSVDELRRLIDSCNVMYGCVFTCMFMGGMGVNEVVYWSDNGLESLLNQLDNNSHPIRVDLPGRKRLKYKKPFYTFLGGDAIRVLRGWIAERGRRDGPIFKTMRDTSVNYSSLWAYYFRHLKALGIVVPEEEGSTSNRYGKNPHEIRDLFRTRWHKSGADPLVAEFMMGHQIDPLGYNKAMRDEAYVRVEYLKAEPWLNLISEDPEKVPRELHERQQLRIDEQQRMIEELQTDNEYLKEVFKEVQEFLKLRKEAEKRGLT
jgi:integrase